MYHLAICTAGFLYAFWLVYVLVMGIYRTYLAGRLTWAMFVLGFPFVIIGGLMDMLSNATVATLVCWQRPHEWFVTQRFEKYLRFESPTGLDLWRYNVAKWVCGHLLNPFDPDGNHCGDAKPLDLLTVPVIKALKE